MRRTRSVIVRLIEGRNHGPWHPVRAVARDPAHAPALISARSPCAALLGVACVLAFVSGLFDGALRRHPLTPVQRALQITLVTAHLA
jgi:hypothetical protein